MPQLASSVLVSPTPPPEYTDKDKKAIRVYPDVHQALGELGKWGESYDDILRRLINFYREKAPKK
jgi:hypothetical protein